MSESYNKMNNNTINNIEMTTEDIKQNIIKILDCMQSIAKEKYKNVPNEDAMILIINKIKTNFQVKKPFIFEYTDFDNIEFYKNIIQIGAYYLVNFDTTTYLDKFLLKNVIDITNILKNILNNNNNIFTNEDVKFYLFHSINVFSSISNEVERSSKFLKIGIKKLIDRYNLKNYDEYFPEGEKQKIKKDFLDLILKIIQQIESQLINQMKKNLTDKISNILDEIGIFKKEIKLEKENLIEYFTIDLIKEIYIKINNLNVQLLNEEYNIALSGLLNKFRINLPDNINDFFYSFEYVKLKKNINIYIDKYFPNEELFLRYAHKEEFCDLIKCIIKLKKYLTLNNIYKGKESFEKEFKEILNDEKFRQKIRRFYNSQKMKNFINLNVDPTERDDVFVQLKKIIKMMENDEFWKKIYFFPLTKYKKAFVTNYLRIIINSSFITLKIFNENEKSKILHFLLFELLVHEIFHLLRRLIYCGKDSLLSLTPPNGKDLEENQLTGEIGERLISYFFKVNKIQCIILEQAEFFFNMDLIDEPQIESLYTIFDIKSSKKMKEMSYAKFNESDKERVIIFEIHDCRKFIYIPPFNYKINK